MNHVPAAKFRVQGKDASFKQTLFWLYSETRNEDWNKSILRNSPIEEHEALRRSTCFIHTSKEDATDDELRKRYKSILLNLSQSHMSKSSNTLYQFAACGRSGNKRPFPWLGLAH